MAIWENITEKAASVAEKAVQQARNLSELAKLHTRITEAERAARDSYEQIGRLYAATHPEDYEEGFGSLISAAANAEATIKDLRKQLRDAKGVAVCEKCGAEIDVDAAFCSACGAPMPKVEPVEAEVAAEEAPCEAPAEAEPCTDCEDTPVEEETPCTLDCTTEA